VEFSVDLDSIAIHNISLICAMGGFCSERPELENVLFACGELGHKIEEIGFEFAKVILGDIFISEFNLLNIIQCIIIIGSVGSKYLLEVTFFDKTTSPMVNFLDDVMLVVFCFILFGFLFWFFGLLSLEILIVAVIFIVEGL